MGVTIVVQGAQAMLSRLQQLGINALDAANNAVDDAMSEFSDQMKQNAQAGHPSGPNTITGTLVGSINWEHVGDYTAKAGVLNDPGYAIYVEYGHSQQPGRFVPAIGKRLVASQVQPYPYFQPTISQMVDSGRIREIVINTLRAAMGT